MVDHLIIGDPVHPGVEFRPVFKPAQVSEYLDKRILEYIVSIFMRWHFSPDDMVQALLIRDDELPEPFFSGIRLSRQCKYCFVCHL